ncbi:MAG TPA: asparagine synthase (glutamine-hydrolyzing) [Thermoanaerobaculaceae bacterium]|nr:asparagine synthase (glutamine-hydrolyzing) [Thermoanaerobaculaceae bacterium]
MCGICGFAPVDPLRAVDRTLVERMTAPLVHRGPDGAGVATVPGVGLGIRRLAIVDLATGDQPISSEDGSITVVCNGEIYNAPELRRELEAAGHRFRTHSDVEPVVHLFEDVGLEFVTRLRGMFGLALWDAGRRRLVLARDRLGIKPLVYRRTPSGLWFGSEVKSLLAGGEVDRSVEPAAVEDLLTLGFVRTPRTLFAGIRRLPPAHLLVWERGEARVRRYWDPPFVAGRSPLGEREWAEALLAKLEETVRVHLRSDVEVGAWLSPGVDSSTVVHLASRLLGRPPRTLTLAFSDPRADETRAHRTLDTYPGHGMPNEQALCDDRSFDLFPRAVWHMEEPTAYAIEIPRLVLARSSARSVKVVVTGEGADEVLGGYPYFRANSWTSQVARLPLRLRRALVLGRALEARRPWIVPLILAPREMGPERYRRLVGVVPAAEAGEVLSDEITRLAGRETSDDGWPLREPGGGSPSAFSSLRLREMQVRLPDFVLHTNDRAAMAFGLEVRVPFLDHELVELCAGIPPSLLLRWNTEKYILRRALEPSLPAEICWRRKRGMLAPFTGWWRGPLPAFAEEMLGDRRLRTSGYFAPAPVREALRRHRAGEADLSQVLNAVLGVQLWDEMFLRGRGLVDAC